MAAEQRREQARRRTVERIRGTPVEVELVARRLRRRLTPAERTLWDSLRGRGLDGFKFRRQQPMGPFILDFCCATRKLVVELDGVGHQVDDQRALDAARTAQLEAYGYRILRFTNEQVLTRLPEVIESTRAALAESVPDAQATAPPSQPESTG